MFDDTSEKWFRRIAIGFVVLLAFLIVNPITFVEEGTRGVVKEWGNVTGEILEPGMHLVIPVQEEVIDMNVMKQKDETPESTASRDQQKVKTTIAVNFHLNPQKVDQIYTEMGKRYADTVITPTVSEYVKKATAKFTAEELITKRGEVKDMLTTDIRKSLAKDHIVVDDVFFTNFAFSKQFNKAIESKVEAEQKALEAKNKLKQVEYEAQQKIEQAKADAQAIKIQSEAIQQQGGEAYVKLQFAKKWDGKLPTQMVPGQSVPFVDVSR